jgi:hypothetical protein
MFMLDNKPLALDVPFTHAEIQYPANWLRLASPAERAAIGITEVADPVPHDDRFYWGPGLPKDLDQLKAQMVGQVKSIAGSLLAPTDWKVTRAAEGVKAVDAETLAARAAIRAASDANEAAVLACSSVDQLAALQFTWPQTAV